MFRHLFSSCLVSCSYIKKRNYQISNTHDNKQPHIHPPSAVQITRLFLVRQEAVVTEEEPLPHRSPKTTTASSNYRNSEGIITLPPVSQSLNKKQHLGGVSTQKWAWNASNWRQGEATVGRWVSEWGVTRLKATTAGTPKINQPRCSE